MECYFLLYPTYVRHGVLFDPVVDVSRSSGLRIVFRHGVLFNFVVGVSQLRMWDFERPPLPGVCLTSLRIEHTA